MPKSIRHKLTKPHHLWGCTRSAHSTTTMEQYDLVTGSNPLETLTESLVHSIATREAFSYETACASSSVSEEEFQCSQCQGILYRPVTALCGRSFCLRCSRKERVQCGNCKEQHETKTLSKLNVALEKIVETWYEDEYQFYKLLQEGDNLLTKKSFDEAEEKFTLALEKKPFHNYASVKRALSRLGLNLYDLALSDITSVKMRCLCSHTPNVEHTVPNTETEQLVAEEERISKTIVKTYLEVLSMLQQSSPRFKVVDSLHSLKQLSHQAGPSHSLIPHQVHSAKLMPPTMEDENTTLLLECESTLDAVISEEVSASDWKSKFVASSTSLKHRSLSEEDFAKKFDEDDYSCILCTRPFYDPVCTPCGHTFCIECLERCFDHGQVCPMCKTTLTDIYRYQKFLLFVDWSVESFMKRFLPKLCEEREQLRREENDKFRGSLPVFVCAVAFPKIKTMLHVFEPRYRLMIRRAIKFHGGSFGITIPSSTTPFHCIGTIITVEKVSFFPDGRSLITAVGSSRFKVDEYGTCDGYATAKVSYITDDTETFESRCQQTADFSNEVYTKAKAWFDRSSENFKHSTSLMYGEFPDQDDCEGTDGPKWAWWLTAVLPVSDDVKSLILGKTCLRTRLNIMNLILNKIG